MSNFAQLTYPIMRRSRLHRSDSKLLLLKKDEIGHYSLVDLPYLLPEDSVLVVNNASTIPASLIGKTPDSELIEIRLTSSKSSNFNDIKSWNAIALGQGNWRQDTNERHPPPELQRGDILSFKNLKAEIVDISQISNRWVELRFLGHSQQIWQQLFEIGKPVQYSHLNDELKIWDIQTIFSSIPVSVEAASASFQFTWSLVDQIEQMGIEIIPITHGMSLSSTGDKILDKKLPFPENYWITEHAAKTINSALGKEKRIIGIGTSVTRALEAEYLKHGCISSGHGIASLVIDENHYRNVVTDLFTGLHLPSESHIKLLTSFIELSKLESAYKQAIDKGYYWHEYGDVSLILSN